MLAASGSLEKTGVCCINMGHDVPDENISALLETVSEVQGSDPVTG